MKRRINSKLKELMISLLILLLFGVTGKAEELIKVIDNFDSLTGWEIFSANLKTSRIKGFDKNCLCLDYDLSGPQKWVVVSKKINALTLPKNYKISFYLKGTGLQNTLEFKLIDKKGNVFWKKWEDFRFPKKWKKITVKKNDIEYAWGSDPRSVLKDIKKIEFSLSKQKGGKGQVCIDQLILIHDNINVKVEASSYESSDKKPENIIDQNKSTCWSSKFSDPQWITIDLGKTIDLIGLILFWETAYGKSYDILISTDGKDWNQVYRTKNSKGGIDDIDFDLIKARYIKIYCRQRGTYWGYSIYEVVLKTKDHPWGEGEDEGVINKFQWSFKTDPENIGEKKRWYSNIKSFKKWPKLKTGMEWEKQGYYNYDGVAWYKAVFYIPSNWKNEEPVLLLNDIFNEYKLYINGRFIKQFKQGKNNKQIKIKKYIKVNALNLFSLRVKNTTGIGGIKGSVILIQNRKIIKNRLQSLKKKSYKDYYYFLAQIEPDGYFPYWLKNDQGFWTVTGVENDYKENLFYEDGTIEPYKSFSISPFLYYNNKLITRGDVKVTQSLEKGYLPVPSVIWKHSDLTMKIKINVSGKSGRSITYAWYKIKNTGKKRIKGKLFLALRPFEINPPWQWGGFNKIHRIKYSDHHITAEKYRIIPLSKPSGFGVSDYKNGDITHYLKNGKLPARRNLYDKHGFASGALEYHFSLSPGNEKDLFIAIPLYNNIQVKEINQKPSKVKKSFLKKINKSMQYWETRLNKNIEINIPDLDIIKTLKANLAYIFINKDGPAIQPGSRAYEAAWIRDGALTSAALLRMGYTKEVKEYINWYIKHIYKDGRVPAIVIIGRNEINPVKEYDSQGELIYTILQYYYFTKDKGFLKEKWPVILKSLKYLEYLRDQRISKEYKNNYEKKRYYGILPMSVSHEGYYPEPGNHSYWDNFWALKGWKDARKIAEIIGQNKEIDWLKREEEELREAVYSSIRLTIKQKNINYIPGCAELGDFDPTSTAIAVMVCNEHENLPRTELKNTFNKYFKNVIKRFDPEWTGSFTPYEVRSVQAFLYMNQKQRALKLLKYLLTLRRPLSWRLWSEAVYFPVREGGYIGDMPHTWVGSGYINTIRSLFVYEDETKASLILGAGINENWFDKQKFISIKGFPTYYGNLNYSMKKKKNQLKIRVWGDADPTKGFIFINPFLKLKIKNVVINNKKQSSFSDHDLSFKKLPVDILIHY